MLGMRQLFELTLLSPDWSEVGSLQALSDAQLQLFEVRDKVLQLEVGS